MLPSLEVIDGVTVNKWLSVVSVSLRRAKMAQLKNDKKQGQRPYLNQVL